jgi:hypothetical protein
LTPKDVKIQKVDSDYCRYGSDASGNVTGDLNGRIIVRAVIQKNPSQYRRPGTDSQSGSRRYSQDAR